MPVDIIIWYFLGLTAVASLLLAWFYTGFTMMLADTAKKLGWRKDDAWFWEHVTSKEQLWDVMTMLHPNVLTELLTCPVCLSFHLSFWIGVATLILQHNSLPVYYPVLTAVTFPILSNLILIPFSKK